jgi:hypothetical protein
MNEQQLAAVKLALVALEEWYFGCGAGSESHDDAVEAIKQAIAQDALDKMAENARELGWSYDTPLSSFVRSSDEAKTEVMERVIDKATEEQKAVIGCVNHDCDQCKAVREPVFCEYCGGNDDADFGLPTDHCTDCARPQPDYAWPTIADYEKEVGFEVNDAFKAAWTMARTTNDLFKQMGEIK